MNAFIYGLVVGFIVGGPAALALAFFVVWRCFK